MLRDRPYADVSVVIDGAVDTDITLYSEEEVESLVDRETMAYGSHGLDTDIYVLWHDHGITDEECSCVQYVTDHHPYVSLRVEEDD